MAELRRVRPPDRARRDEWSEGAVSALLDAYEKRWDLRSRAKLKAEDWEDVSLQVCARDGGGRPLKTLSQCKNKVEALKKKYRSESCGSSGPVWPLFHRMDLLLRCPALPLHCPHADSGQQPSLTDLALQGGLLQVDSLQSEQILKGKEKGILLESELIPRDGPMDMVGMSLEDASHAIFPRRRDSTVDTSRTRDRGACAMDGFGSEAAKRRRKSQASKVAESIRCFADSLAKLEKEKMEMYKDSERLRVEAEARRIEMELKQTEMVVDTQLQIAKLLKGKLVRRKSSTTASALT